MAHLHFLRKLAEKYPEIQFRHWAHPEYIPQMAAMVADQPRITLVPFGSEPSGRGKWSVAPPVEDSINAWKNAGGWFDRLPGDLRNKYGFIMIVWFQELARRMGLESPFVKWSNLLFDYPALKYDGGNNPKLDFLIINSPPLSGQAKGYDPREMDTLIIELKVRGYSVLATNPAQYGSNFPNTQQFGWDITQIGHISQCCKRIIAVATGPIWPTFNIWNAGKLDLRIVINKPEIVDLDPAALHAKTVGEVRAHLKERALL